MTKRDILREQYEDALFALLMDEVAVSEGEKAINENERLKADPNFIILEEANKKCERLISTYFRRKTVRAVGRSFSRVVGKVAVVALAAMLLFTTAFAVSPVFRAHTLNLVVETFYDRTNFQFTEAGPAVKDVNATTEGWIPEGYALESQTEDSMSKRIVYSSETGGELKVSVFHGSGLLSIDTEDAAVKNIYIQEKSAVVSEKNGVIQITWADEVANLFVSVQGNAVSEEDLIKFAENLNLE